MPAVTDTTTMMLLQISEPRTTRNILATSYALAICLPHERTDWATVNRAIEKRWSRYALDYIKKRAWASFDTAAQRTGGNGWT